MGKEVTEIPLEDLPVAAIDFESAGAAPGETDQPVQIGIVRVESLFGKEKTFDSYLACSRPVRWSASRIHGITTEDLKGAPTLPSLWTTLRPLLSSCVILGHNPSTEIRFLSIFPGHGFHPWLDTLSLARQSMPGLGDYCLSSVCGALGITEELHQLIPGKTWHHALFDAAGSLLAFRAIVRGLHMEKATLQDMAFAVKP